MPTRRDSHQRPGASLLALAIIAIALTLEVSAQAYAVTRVIDGDTLVLDALGTVGLSGIDTPETVDPRVPVQAFGHEAAAHLRALVDGQQVRVDYDHQRRDKYGRTLAYLYLADGTLVNREMVRSGYAHAYLDYTFRHMEDFRAAEAEAREAGRGLWGGDTTPRQAQTAAVPPAEVWVNTSSRVYHCPGTRYYGNTKSGAYTTESAATGAGYRAAGGRACS